MNPHSHFKKEITDLETEQAKEQTKDAARVPPETIPSRPASRGTLGTPATKTGDSVPGTPSNVSRTDGPVASLPAREGRPPGEGRGAGPPSEGGRPPGNWDPMARFAQMDKDSDGKVSKDEAEGRMAENFENYDTDADGAVSKEEFMAFITKLRASGGFGGGGGRPPSNAGGN